MINKEPISRNGTRLHKDDVVRVLECCTCKCCTPFKGSLATITETQDEDEWLRAVTRFAAESKSTLAIHGGKEPLLRLKMPSNRTSCCFRACNVDFVSRGSSTENQTYIDHIYDRVTQNITPGEVRILANRLHAFADTR